MPPYARGSVSLTGAGQGESLVPPYTRGSVSLTLSYGEPKVQECEPLVSGPPGAGLLPKHHECHECHSHGRLVQVEPMNPMLKAPGT